MQPIVMEATEQSGIRQIQDLLPIARRLGLLKGGVEYMDGSSALFSNLDFRGKNVLEIGCGKGMMCLWAKLHGANRVVGLEPMAEGWYDSSKSYKDFNTMVRELGLQNIEMLPARLQDYRGAEGQFDIVLSVASINHLDEQSCIELRDSAAARERYARVFHQVRDLMAGEGRLLVFDATNRSFFSDVGMKNPFNPHIEWFKHQPPECWAGLLSTCGFANPRISWMSGSVLTHFGIRTVPRVASYFHASAFRLEMDCAAPAAAGVYPAVWPAVAARN